MINTILDVNANDELAQTTVTLNKVLDEILLQPKGPKRWRAAVEVLLKTNPIAGEDSKGQPVSFRDVNQECVLTNKMLRDTAADKFGRSFDNTAKGAIGSGSNFRGYLSMPRLVKTVIEIVDPEAFKNNLNARKMFKTFPEYRTSQEY